MISLSFTHESIESVLSLNIYWQYH